MTGEELHELVEARNLACDAIDRLGKALQPLSRKSLALLSDTPLAEMGASEKFRVSAAVLEIAGARRKEKKGEPDEV